jgi:hypothetical protein
MHGVKAGLPDPFHGYNFAGASLLPAADVAALPDKPRDFVQQQKGCEASVQAAVLS